MKYSREYQLYRDIAIYMKYQYPNVLYHFDPTGLNLSKVQAGMMKAIQLGRGYPDLFIVEKRGIYGGCFIEIKTESTKLFKVDGTPINDHIKEQQECLQKLIDKGYYARFAIGWDMSKHIIDNYLTGKK